MMSFECLKCAQGDSEVGGENSVHINSNRAEWLEQVDYYNLLTISLRWLVY